MESWEYKLAQEFKSRDNPKPLGACIGKVESLNPVCISIQSGQFMLRTDQIYICNQILERETTFKDYIANNTQSGNMKYHGHSGSYSASGDIEANGRVHLDEVWKVGDFVMVVPDERGQFFFIVDIIRGVS